MTDAVAALTRPYELAEPEAARPTDAELIDELDSLLSDVHAGIGSEDAKQVKDSFRAYGQLRAKVGTLVTLTRAVEPGEAELDADCPDES